MERTVSVHCGRDERGFALVSVLWAVAVLSLIAMSLLTSSTLSYQMQRNLWQEALIKAAADAGVHRAIVGLIDARPEKRWRVDGVPTAWTYQGLNVRVTIQDELGKIDLNAADNDLLIRLLEWAGLSPAQASALDDKILDWRDATDTHRLNGAKATQYEEAGYKYRPRNGPFQSVDELSLVMGVTPQLFNKIRPALTVYSGKRFIDPQAAPREALLALPGMDPQAADQIIRAREATNATDTQGTPSGVLDPSASFVGRAFTITSDIAVGNFKVTRRAIVRLTEDATRPYWMLMWQ
jgi:general secretion pathway protein K